MLIFSIFIISFFAINFALDKLLKNFGLDKFERILNCYLFLSPASDMAFNLLLLWYSFLFFLVEAAITMILNDMLRNGNRYILQVGHGKPHKKQIGKSFKQHNNHQISGDNGSCSDGVVVENAILRCIVRRLSIRQLHANYLAKDLLIHEIVKIFIISYSLLSFTLSMKSLVLCIEVNCWETPLKFR